MYYPSINITGCEHFANFLANFKSMAIDDLCREIFTDFIVFHRLFSIIEVDYSLKSNIYYMVRAMTAS